MANETLTGGGLGLGTAVNKNQTDTFTVAGAGNIIDTFGGNETITGVNLPPFGFDNATIVNLGSTAAVSPASNVQVVDTIALNGGNNTIDTLSGVTLTDSTVTITLAGTGGGNLVEIVNIGGVNTVTAGGLNNQITLNADATNTVTAGTGSDFVFLGTPGAPVGGGFVSNVTLGGSGNVVEASDQKLTVGGGVSNNQIIAGNGNDAVTLTGSGNLVGLGDGSDSVSISGSNNDVFLEFFGPSVTPNSDFVSIGGDFNVVEEATSSDRNNVVVNIAGAIGFNDVILGDGNDSANVGGQNNVVELGNGNDVVSLLGAGGFNDVQVGSGLDTVTVNGNGNVINVNPGNLVTTDTVTATGNNNRINIGAASTITSSTLNLGGGSGDLVTLGNGSFNVNGTGSNNAIFATDNAAASNNINLGGGNANAIFFGDGTDVVTDNGNGNVIVGGNGNDVVNASGNSNFIQLGNGNDILNLGGNGNGISLGSGNNIVNGGNGSNNSIIAHDVAGTANFYNFGTGNSNGFSLGDGNDTVTDNGNIVTVFAGNGNDTINANGNTVGIGLGSGNNVISATGTGDTITIAGTQTSTDTLTVGSNSAGSITGGTLTLNIGSNTFSGNGDNFVLSGIQAGSTVNVFGTNDFLEFTKNSAGTVNLANNVQGDTIDVQGVSGTYDGALTIDNFQNNGVNATIDFEGLFGGVDHNSINSLSEIAANSKILGGGTLEVLLQNHGSLLFPLITGLNASNVHFS